MSAAAPLTFVVCCRFPTSGPPSVQQLTDRSYMIVNCNGSMLQEALVFRTRGLNDLSARPGLGTAVSPSVEELLEDIALKG